MPDLRAQVPDLVPYLEPNEKVIEVIEYDDVNQPALRGLPSSLSQLLRMAGAERLEELGSSGPVVASKAQQHEERQELKAYEVLFGRDSLIVADFLRNYYPNLFDQTMLRLAYLQGLEYDAVSEEERGKIVHEARDPSDPIAREITSRLGWGWPYYGAVDATPLYVFELTRRAKDDPEFLGQKYIDKSGSERTLFESLGLALEFIESHIAKSDLGLLEYRRLNPNGLQNQWWADSWDSMSRSDGTVANHDKPIAALVVQAFAYDALLGASELYRKLGESDRSHIATAEKYQAMADHIKKQVMDKFWKEDEAGGFFVVGLDRDQEGNIRQLDAKTCNMGFVLTSRLLDDGSQESRRKADQTIKVLFSEEMQNVSGIRTLSNKEKRYKPGGYHTGNVWLWVNNWVANGIEKHARLAGRPDYSEKAWVLREKTWRVIQKYKKFPELINGGDAPEPVLNWRRVTTYHPEAGRNLWLPGRNIIEQPAQDYQAWTVAAYIDALRKNNPYHRNMEKVARAF